MLKMFDVIIPIRSKSKELKNKNILPFYKTFWLITQLKINFKTIFYFMC